MKRLSGFNKKGVVTIDSAWIKLLLLIILIIVITVGAIRCDRVENDTKWNGGVCPNDGTKWTFVQAVGHRYSTYYIYACDHCGNKIEVDIEPEWADVVTTTETES